MNILWRLKYVRLLHYLFLFFPPYKVVVEISRDGCEGRWGCYCFFLLWKRSLFAFFFFFLPLPSHRSTAKQNQKKKKNDTIHTHILSHKIQKKGGERINARKRRKKKASLFSNNSSSKGKKKMKKKEKNELTYIHIPIEREEKKKKKKITK